MATNVSSIPDFGRRWQLQILTQPINGSKVLWTIGQDEWLPEAARVTFDINESGYTNFWWADINIYNLEPNTQSAIISQAAQVVLSAGYQDSSNYGIIFQGNIFQFLWTRENVVDYKLTLHCLAGPSIYLDNMTSLQSPALSTQRDIILKMAQQAEPAMPISYLDEQTLGTQVLPRGEIVFGSARKYMAQVAKSNGFQYFWNGTGAMAGDPTPTLTNPQLIYSSVPDPSNNNKRQNGIEYTIIDTPRQIPEGVEMRVLLDSRLIVTEPAIVVKIDNTVIQQMLATPPSPGQSAVTASSSQVPILSQNGVYAVGAVRHRGDTRGNEWYTDVVMFNYVSGIIAALAIANSQHGGSASSGGKP